MFEDSHLILPSTNVHTCLCNMLISWTLLLQNLLAKPICVMFCYYVTIQRVYVKSSSFVDFLKPFAHHGRVASNRENPPSTKIAIYSQQQKLIANFMPERAKECGINEDSVKHPSSLSDRLPQVCEAVATKLQTFPPSCGNQL